MQLSAALSESEVEAIDRAAFDLLERRGFRVMHEEALERLGKAGATVEASGLVRMPRSLMAELLAQVPRTYQITGLDGIVRTIGGGEQYGNAIVTDPWIIDYETGGPRRPRLEDLRRNTIVAQQLGHVAGIGRMDFPVTDVEGPASSHRALLEHLLHHAKHYYVYVTSLESLDEWIEIGRVLTGGEGLRESSTGRALFSTAVASLTPLTITAMNVELLKTACRYGMPVVPTVCPSAGTTSPHSLAGTLLVGHIECLMIAALAQLYRPGHPFLYTFGPAVTDMRSGTCLYYTFDKVLWKYAHVQLAKAHNLPASTECGGATTFRADAQHGAEGVLFMLAAAASGADQINGFGSTYNAIGHSTEMMVIQSGWLELARFLQRGIPTDPVRLAVEEIAAAGPGGHFMMDELTLRTMRGGEFATGERLATDLFDWSGEPDGKPLMERAHEKVAAMVEGFESPVPIGIQEALRRHFRDRLGVRA